MKRDIILQKDKPYHIIARAVEGKTIFPSKAERDRFIVQMYIANFGNPLHIARKDFSKASSTILAGKAVPSFLPPKSKDPLVRCFSFALVGNHYHLGLAGRFDNAISKYMQRLNTGFAKYFNLKYKRSGSLFETRFRAVAVTNPRQLAALLEYINIKNVLDVYSPKWAQKKEISLKTAGRFLHEYPYSSFPDVFLQRTSHVIDKDILHDISEGSLPTAVFARDALIRIQDVIERKGATLTLPLPLE